MAAVCVALGALRLKAAQPDATAPLGQAKLTQWQIPLGHNPEQYSTASQGSVTLWGGERHGCLSVLATASSTKYKVCVPRGAWACNAGVLKFKHESELALMASGLPYTLLRPSRLTDGPYTSYDLNTLLQVGVGPSDMCAACHDHPTGFRCKGAQPTPCWLWTQTTSTREPKMVPAVC